ncbi:MAG: M20 aminoacylase family protein [Hyphomicrobiaceae bacterium]
MELYPEIVDIHDQMTVWRQDLHAYPETAFEEHRTSEFVAEKLAAFGVDEVVRGLARTGVVGIVRGRCGAGRAVGLRADIDALDISEQTNKSYASKNEGKMHACGHDGHTTMLLGAAKYLAETRNFAGTVYLIFQPAEENEGGGRVMIEDGLFEKYPMEQVFGLHNWPGEAAGKFSMRTGPVMASYDIFDITVEGHGAHGAMPHQGIDPIVAAAQIVTSLQSIASRNVDPIESIVVSVTQIHGGDAYNVIPETVNLKGTVRAFKPAVQDLAEKRISEIASRIAEAHNARAHVRYERRYPSTVNTPVETEVAANVAAKVVGGASVQTDVPPVMGSEDFAFMLNEKPGSYVFLGCGEHVSNLHSPQYDFNDEILPIGASYWARLVEETLASG